MSASTGGGGGGGDGGGESFAMNSLFPIPVRLRDANGSFARRSRAIDMPSLFFALAPEGTERNGPAWYSILLSCHYPPSFNCPYPRKHLHLWMQ